MMHPCTPALFLLLTSTGTVNATEIHNAARTGDLAKVRLLIQQDSSCLKASDARGRQPVHEAARGGHLDVLDFLQERGADLNAPDAQTTTPLHEAAAANRAEVVTFLLGKGAHLNVLDYKQRTPLHFAVIAGARESVAALIKGKANLELKDAWGRTPLVLGVRERCGPEVARMLLAAGGDVLSRDKFGSDALELAAWRGSSDMVDLLLDHKAVVPPPGPAAMRLLSLSATGGLTRLFRALAAKGADLTQKNVTGGSLLHDAARGGSAEIVSELIGHGMDMRAQDTCGWTPIHYAALEGRTQVLKMLLSKGADPNARNLAGQTPLNVAEASGHKALKETLLEAKADPGPALFPDLKGNYLGQPLPGRTPKLLARGIVSSIWGLHSSVAFSPDGSEAYWRAMNDRSGALQSMKRVNGQWKAPAPAAFSGSSIDDVPFFAPDGSRLYFLSERPIPGHAKPTRENIWFVDRKGSDWSEPRPLDPAINALEMHWQFSVDRAGNVFFGSQAPDGKGGGDIWMARFENGRYRAPENLGGPINSSKTEGDPFIAPDGSYLLFNREMDLYISFRQKDGVWTEPIVLDAPINTRADERCPLVTPDGKYLVYNSTRAGESGAYWVEANFIEELRKTAHLPSAATVLQGVLGKEGLAAAQATSRDMLAHRDHYRFKEADLIALGYRFLQGRQYVEALAVFEITAGAFPDSWNAWDSLGEALVKVGDRNKADIAYARSLALNPRNERAKEVLNETKEALRHSPGAPTA